MYERTIFDELGVWSVQINLRTGGGYTLWAHKGSREILLGVCNYMLIFVSESRLRSFILSAGECNLSEVDGYGKLRDLLSVDIDAATLAPDRTYDFQEVITSLSIHPFDSWDLERCSLVLGCLNMLWDIAHSVDEQTVIDQIRSDREMRGFIDFLTFVGEDNVANIRQFNAESLLNLLTEDLTRIEAKVLVVC